MRPGLTVAEIAHAIGGTLVGAGDVVIASAASVADAAPGDIVLAENARFLAAAANSAASAVLAQETACGDKTVISVADPRSAFVLVLEMLAPKTKRPKPGVDPGARIGERFSLGPRSSVGFGTFVGDDVAIGNDTIVHPLVYLGDGVRIGDGSTIHPHVAICAGCEIGSGVTIHAGTVLGGDGFGYVPAGDQLVKVPQIGKVVVEDDVEIGANTTIDRAKTGTTKIGRGTKIDNLVQIAHNVKTGEMCLIVAQAGLAGSVELSDRVTLAWQVGVREHVKIGGGVTVAGQSGVYGDLDGGGVYSGTPARRHSEALKAQAAILRLVETRKSVEKLEREVASLKQRVAELIGDRVERSTE